MPKPTVGRIVLFNTTSTQKRTFSDLETQKKAVVRDQLPAMIVGINYPSSDPFEEAVTETTVNLKVFTDGQGEIWQTKVKEGSDQGQWSWPTKQKQSEDFEADKKD